MERDAASRTEPKSALRRGVIALGAFAIIVAVSASVVLGRMQRAPTLLAFFGRFHPLLVHLPIGMFVLVVMAETATLHPRLRQRIDPFLGLALPVTVLGALAAFVLGHFLALTGDYPEHVLGWHRRLELCAVIGAALALIAWELQEGGSFARARTLYRALLFGSVGLLSLGAHFGGTITHGETYLTAFAPAPLQALLGAPPKKQEPPKAPEISAEPTVFDASVEPVLTRYCADCHGANKQSGKLRLDSLAAILKGGDSGPAIAPGAVATSELMKRMLAPAHDDNHMPPANKPQPSAEEIALIGFWIDRGATPVLRVRDALPPASTRALLEGAVGGKTAAIAPSNVPTQTAASTAGVATSSVATAAAAGTTSGANETSAPPASAGGGSLAPFAILNRRCGSCHGANVQRSGLRTDSLAALLHGGDDGPALVPGNPGQSHLIQRVRLPSSDDDHMPPSGEPQLTAGELAALGAWVKNGAGSANGAGDTAKTALASSTTPSVDAERAADSATPSTDASAASAPSALISAPAASAASSSAPPANAPPSQSAPVQPASHADAHAVVHGSGCASCTLGGGSIDAGLPVLGAAFFGLAAFLRRGRRKKCAPLDRKFRPR